MISEITSAQAFLTFSSESYVSLSYIGKICEVKLCIDITFEAFMKFLTTAYRTPTV